MIHGAYQLEVHLSSSIPDISTRIFQGVACLATFVSLHKDAIPVPGFESGTSVRQDNDVAHYTTEDQRIACN